MLTSDATSMVAQVEYVLAQMRPSIQMHGGDVELVSVCEDTVYIRLMGACIGCPISSYTVKLGIEQTLRDKVVGISHVVQVEG